MSIRIRIEHGQDAGKTFRLAKNGVYLLGRHPASSLRVLDMKVSKAHCEVHLVESNGSVNAFLRDLGSTHGCLVNGQPVKQDRGLNPGDELRLGLTILRVLSDGEADEELAPAAGRGSEEASVEAAATFGKSTTETRSLPPDELVGKTLAGYDIKQKIGQGGMGAVYLAEQVSLKRQVALKVLSEKFVKDSAFVDQFVNEARSAGALNHPNVVQVYDVGSADGNYYFSMEFVTGGSIEERLKHEPTTWQEALNWFLDATNALVFAQKREILHRDVKPDNLMISEDGSAKLCDLGLAKRSELSDLMAEGIIGTPHFISPEAIRRKTAVDHRTDLYSLGCTFFRIFSGKNPYPGKTVKEILLGHLNKPVPHVTDHNRDVPRELDEIVHKLMQKDPDDRFQEAGDLLVALDKVRLQHGLEAHGIRPHSKKPLVIGAAVALLAAAAALIFVLNQEEKVIVKPIPPEVKIDEARNYFVGEQRALEGFVVDAQSQLGKLDRRRMDGEIKLAENWKKNPYWTDLTSAYDAAADTWQAQLETWETTSMPEWDEKAGAWDVPEAATFHQELRDEAATQFANLRDHVTAAQKASREITDYIKKRARNEATEKRLRTEALAESDRLLGELAAKSTKMLADGEYVELALALGPGKVKEALEPALAKAVFEGEVLVSWDDDIVPMIAKHLPGEPWGQKWIDAAIAEIKERHSGALAAVAPLLKPKPGDPPPTHADYEKAIGDLDAYIKLLPMRPDAEAGEIAELLRSYRTAATRPRDSLMVADLRLRWDELRADKAAYFELVRMLRAPKEDGGRFALFLLTAARDGSAAVKMHTEEYRELADVLVRDATALAALFASAITSFKSWDNKSIDVVDERGRTRSTRIKDIADGGLDCGSKQYQFAELGPQYLLDNLFYHREEPRFEFEPEHLRGLALLAEMAGDNQAALKHWQAYERGLSGSGGEHVAELTDVRRKLGALEPEMRAAAHYFAILEAASEIEAFLDGHDRAKIGDRAYTKEIREEMSAEEAPMQKRLMDLQGRWSALWETPELAGTIWGSSIRGAPHDGVAYAGEELPPPLPGTKRRGKPDGDGN